MRRKFLEIQSRGTFFIILSNAMEFAVCHYHNDFLICIKSKITFDLFLVECEVSANVKCDASHAPFDINCQSNRSFALNSNAQSVFYIVRTFNNLGVECDVKQFHIAFDKPKTPFYLPIPETFSLVEFCRIRLFARFVESG